ncbi:MAG TPA: heme o synthase [Vicinamibacterales bacterium]|nr:heme o synthase [Vicinamibacterales bacterium]
MKPGPADAAAIALPDVKRATGVGDYLALTKPRLNFLVVATSAAGYYLGSTGSVDTVSMAEAVAGTALVAGGAAVLNQLYERDTDALMRRTRTRPLPAGRVGPTDALVFGLALAAAGLALLAARANWLSAGLALATLITYLAIYTPMKRRTPLSTIVGAVPGALPALIGWTASRGSIDLSGAALFAIVFCWQLPHFMAIAWLYREDYRRAGFPMLPVIDPDGRRAGKQAVYWGFLLVLASLEPAFSGLAGGAYFAVALVLGVVLFWLALRFASARNEATARALFYGSITYLPLLWIAMIADKR